MIFECDFGARQLDAAFPSARPGASPRPGAFAHPWSSESESCVEPQHSIFESEVEPSHPTFGARPLLRQDRANSFGFRQGKLVLVEGHEILDAHLNGSSHMPQIQRTTGHFHRAPAGDGLGLPQGFRPVQRLVVQGSVVHVLIHGAEDAAGLGLGNKPGAGALADDGAEFQPVEGSEKYWLAGVTGAVPEGGVGVVVRDVKCDQKGGVEIGAHRRVFCSTSRTPAMGLREIRSSRALKAAALLPLVDALAGTILSHGFPPSVTSTVSPAWTRLPSEANVAVAWSFDTVFTDRRWHRRGGLSSGLCVSRGTGVPHPFLGSAVGGTAPE